MIYLFHGEDSFQIKKETENLSAKLKDAAETIFDSKKLELKDIQSTINTKTLFSKNKTIVIKNLLSQIKKEQEESLLKTLELKKEDQHTVVILQEEKLDKRKKLTKEIIKIANTKEFNFLRPEQISEMLHRKFQYLKINITKKAIEKLNFYTNKNTARLSKEIEKITHYGANKESITEEDIDLLVIPEKEANIFEFTEDLAAGKKLKSQVFFNTQIDTKNNGPYLSTMIAYQIRNMILVKELQEKGMNKNEIAKAAKLHPFVVQKTMAITPNYSLAKLKHIHRNILILDKDLKSKNAPKEAFEKFLTSY